MGPFKNQLDASVSNVIARYNKLGALNLKLAKVAHEPGKSSPKGGKRRSSFDASSTVTRRNSFDDSLVVEPSGAAKKDEFGTFIIAADWDPALVC